MLRRITVLASVAQILLLWMSSPTMAAAIEPECGGSAAGAIPEAAKEICGKSRQLLIDPSLTSVTRRTDFQALVSATREDTTAAIEIGIRTKEDVPKKRSTVRHAIKLSGPIGKDASVTDLTTLEGLQDNVQLSYVASIRTRDPNALFRGMTPRDYNVALCRAHQIETIAGEEDPLIPKNYDCSKGELPDDALLSVDELREQGLRHFLDALGLSRGSFIYGVEATYAADKQYDFITTDSLTKQSEKHDGISVGVELGWLPYRKGFYFVGLSYRFEEGHKPQSEQEICAPFGEDLGALSCSKLAVGAPSRSTKEIASFEVRRYFRDGSLALSPRYSYDFDNDVSGVRFPIYFLKDGSGVLNGGIAAGWRSDTEDYTLSLFIGTMKNPVK